MTIEEARVLLHEELRKQPSLTAQDLSDQTGIAVMMCYKVLKADVENSLVSMEMIGEMKHYTILEQVSEQATDESVAESPQVDKSNDDKDLKVSPAATGRDTTKFMFNKKPYSKSGCVLAVLTAHVNTRKPSFDQVKETFPDSIVGRFGVINTLDGAKKLSPDRPRYFMKSDQTLTTSDNVIIAVCNQWTLGRFVEFMNAAGKLGYKISPETTT